MSPARLRMGPRSGALSAFQNLAGVLFLDVFRQDKLGLLAGCAHAPEDIERVYLPAPPADDIYLMVVNIPMSQYIV